MTLQQGILRQLYEKVIRQEPYAGGACPAEHVLTAYATGALAPSSAKRADEHLAQCSACRGALAKLKDAGQWFEKNESRILTGLAIQAGMLDVLPWAKCPGTQLLYRYAQRQIRETGGGKTLLAEIGQHLWQCRQCAALVEEFRAAADGVGLSIGDLGTRAVHAVQTGLANFFDAMAGIARASGSVPFVRGVPSFRGEQAPSVQASIVDARGNVLLDDDGQARQCRFEVIQAAIARDGFLTLDLIATDAAYFSKADRYYHALAWLVAGGMRLALAPTLIDEQGRSTFTGMLPDAPAVDALPLSMIDLVVRPPEGESDAI